MSVVSNILPCIFFYHDATARQWARVSSLSRLHDHTQTHHTRYDSSGRVISPTPRPVPDNTQRSQQTITLLVGFEGVIPRKRQAAYLRIRPRGHRGSVINVHVTRKHPELYILSVFIQLLVHTHTHIYIYIYIYILHFKDLHRADKIPNG